MLISDCLAKPSKLLLAFSLLLSACAAPAANQPSPAEDQSLPASSATPAPATASPVVEPSPSATQLPYTGPNPRLAVLNEQTIQVFELGSETLVASLPAEDSAGLFTLSPDGRRLFSHHLNGVNLVYNLDTGESHPIDLSSALGGEDYIARMAWTPSQEWLSFSIGNANGGHSLWAYNLASDQLTHIDDITYTVGWSGQNDVVSYMRDEAQFPRITYDYTTGEKTPWPSRSFESILTLLTRDGLAPDSNSFSCELCVLPELGPLVRDYASYNRSANLHYYDLIDFDTAELLAHVATFRTERDMSREYFVLDVVKLLPLWQRGDYLLFVQEGAAGASLEDFQTRFYSAWSPSGEMPFTVMEGEPTNTLPYVIPMAVSPDGASFAGFRITTPEPYMFLLDSVLIIDLATAEILYEYPLSGEFFFFSPPNEVDGVDLVWPAD